MLLEDIGIPVGILGGPWCPITSGQPSSQPLCCSSLLAEQPLFLTCEPWSGCAGRAQARRSHEASSRCCADHVRSSPYSVSSCGLGPQVVALSVGTRFVWLWSDNKNSFYRKLCPNSFFMHQHLTISIVVYVIHLNKPKGFSLVSTKLISALEKFTSLFNFCLFLFSPSRK